MAKYKPNGLGQISGKLGNLIFYQLNGQEMIRQKQDFSSRKLSELQLYHQQIFRMVQTFLNPIREELDYGMQEFVNGGKRGIHQAMSWALKNAVVHGKQPTLLPEKIRVSMGVLTSPTEALAERISDQQIRVSWSPNSWQGWGRDSDQAYVLAIHADSFRCFSIREGAYRKSGVQLLDIPWENAENDRFWIYLAFSREMGRKRVFSDSIGLGLH